MNNQGVSLLELIVVIIIIAIISVVALPKWYFSSNSMHYATDRLIQALQVANETAITSGYKAELEFTGNSYTVTLISSPNTILIPATDIDSSLTVTTSNSLIEFHHPHGLPSSVYSVVISKGGNSNAININNLGEISVIRN